MAESSSSNNAILSLIGWYVLPNVRCSLVISIWHEPFVNSSKLVTGWLQTALYAVFIGAGDPKPAPGSPRFVRDRRRLQIFVIVAYLLCTIYDADYQLYQAGDFYQDLGVPHDVAKSTLMSKARRL